MRGELLFFFASEASDVNAEGVPAVFFAANAAPVLGQKAPGLPVRLLPGRGGARLGVVLVVLVEVAVLHHAEAGGGAEVLTAAFVLLNGLVQRPQLAQQGHVLLTQAHLETDNTEVNAGQRSPISGFEDFRILELLSKRGGRCEDEDYVVINQ